MAVSIKSPRVDALLEQLRQLTGRGVTEIVGDALELELQRQRLLSRRRRLSAELPVLQEQAIKTAKAFDADSLYDEQGLPS
ncbi:MAG: type II toxin-antitoxin system VapB family antitoxin [Synechococcus sp.]|nr:type II toxin-antitoxin system VapB family antitoxin [Synechococcus sp.]